MLMNVDCPQQKHNEKNERIEDKTSSNMRKTFLLAPLLVLLIVLCMLHFVRANQDPISEIIKTRGSKSEPNPTPATKSVRSLIDPIIIDNSDAEFKGSWEKGEVAKDKYGKDYRYIEAGNGSNYALFRPHLPATGLYDVFEWHGEGKNRTNEAEIVITHAQGKERVLVDQKTGGGKWSFIGRLALSEGKDCYVKVTDRFSRKTGDVVIADAFKFNLVMADSAIKKISTPRKTPAPKSIKPFGFYVQQVIDELEKRKKKGASGYLMKDKYGKYTGVTQTLYYRGKAYMWNECKPGERVKFPGGGYYKPYGQSYCSGLTLEIFHRAMKKRDRDMGIPDGKENWNGLGTKGIFIFKKLWNVIRIRYKDTGKLVSSRPSPATAIEISGLGKVITYGDTSKFDQVRKYDFCDISRSTGYGHSIVFLGWKRRKRDGRIIGFRYYSTQKKTDGQGYRTEYFEGYGGKVLKSQFHAGRVYDHPRDWAKNHIREAEFK